jgi:valyl-tRNA synthetase
VSRLHVAIEAARKGIDEYRLDDASNALYHFIWHELCDWFLELSKPLLSETQPATMRQETSMTLIHVLETSLRLLHPMMPFITEEIWQRIPKDKNAPQSLVIHRYPEADKDARTDAIAEREMEQLQQVIVATRTIRSEHDVSPKKHIDIRCYTDTAEVKELVQRTANLTGSMIGGTIEVDINDTVQIDDNVAMATAGLVTVQVPLTELVDADKERERLTRKLNKTLKDLTAVEKKLSNAGFVQRAPQEIVAREKARQKTLTEERDKLETALKRLF